MSRDLLGNVFPMFLTDRISTLTQLNGANIASFQFADLSSNKINKLEAQDTKQEAQDTKQGEFRFF